MGFVYVGNYWPLTPAIAGPSIGLGSGNKRPLMQESSAAGPSTPAS